MEQWTHGYVHWLDLTLPVSLPKADWVMSLEVGEHIPNRFEALFLRNLHAHNCRGIILCWAELVRFGKNHINNHDEAYIANRVTQLGYRLRHDLNHIIVAGDTGNEFKGWRLSKWIRRTRVFERLEPVC